ncbi:hypothetical protein GPALN_012876 [Globodera pallida]|nr:hypothetical protein GPALN_012876 [Globodera pallida]
MASYNGPTPSEYGAIEVNELGHQFNLLREFSGEDVGMAGIPIVRGRSEEGASEGIPIARSYDQQLLLCPTPIPSRTQRPMFSGDDASGIGPSGVPSPLSRRPYLFSVPQNPSLLSSVTEDQHQLQLPYDRMHREHNMAIRYRLFNRLDPGGSHLRMPSHVIPAIFFSVLPFDDFKDPEGKQSSLVTIVGNIYQIPQMHFRLLTIPWAIHQAGFLLGLFLMLLMAALAFYTAYRVVESPNSLALDRTDADFSDVCRFFWGKKGEYFSVFFSVLVLVGGVILYFVLMSNFLYYTGNIVNEALQPNSSILPVIVNGTLSCDVFCPERVEQHEVHDLLVFGERLLFGERNLPLFSQHDENLSFFKRIWTLQGGVPLILAICLFPLLNFKSPTFFMNFNGLGTISIGYLMCFTISKAIECKFNVDFFDRTSEHFVQLFNWKFPALSGTLALAFFIHNAILTILRNQKHPENNSRDLFIGYSLSAFCYVLIGSLFFLAFPTFRDCISDNFLNNFATGDVLSAIARIFLLFQMLTVLPLLMYLIRVQFSYVLVGSVYPGLFYVVLINLSVLLVALSFALFYPHVGAILRYIGSISGLVWMFLLPCGVHMKRLQVQGRLTHWQIGLHSFLILCGVLNLIAQFFL